LFRLRDALRRSGRGSQILVEKILAHDESLDRRWAADGTTGYEFGDRAVGLLLDPAGCRHLAAFGSRFGGSGVTCFGPVRDEAKRLVLDRSFSGDLDRIGRLTQRALERERPGHDLAQRDLCRAWAGLTIRLSVYRTYFDDEEPGPDDLERVTRA